MRCIFPLILIVAVSLLSGCARGNVELLEARLRTREEQLAGLDSERADLQRQLVRSERERDLLRKQLAETSREGLLSEVSRSLARIEDVKINPRLTGILKNGAEREAAQSLNLLFAPVDAHADPVKLEGRAVIELYDFSAPAPQHQLGVWEFTPEETARNWHAGFIGEGFQFSLPLPELGQVRALLINVSFETADGRRFHATHEVQVDATAEPFDRRPHEPVPVPLPLSAGFEHSEPPRIVPADHSREWDALPPPSAKRIPIDQLFGPE